MMIRNTFTIQVPVQELWDYLLDIERMHACIPGVEKVKAVDAETYEATLKVKVGPIAASFGGKVRLLEVVPPSRLVAKVEAKDARTASMVSARFTADLRPLAEDQTEVAYQTDVSIAGALGNFGQGVMREIAKRMTLAFARCVEERLREPVADAGGQSQPPPSQVEIRSP